MACRVWNADTGQCLHELTHHTEPVYTVTFSPDGSLLASGSFDRRLYIWDVEHGDALKVYEGQGGIYEACWDKDGRRVAASCCDKTVIVLDVAF